MRALFVTLLLLIAGFADTAAADPKNDGMKEYVIPTGWNALLNKDRKTAVIIGEFKQPSRGRGMLTLLNRETESELLAEIKRLGYAAIRPAPSPKPQPKDNDGAGSNWVTLQPGWNAVLRKEARSAIILSETKQNGRLSWNEKLQKKPEILHRDTEAALLAEIKRLGYAAIRTTNVTTSSKPAGDDGFKDFIIPVGWNALLNVEERTAAVIGEFKREGRAHSKLTLLHCDTEAELLEQINKIGFRILPPPEQKKK